MVTQPAQRQLAAEHIGHSRGRIARRSRVREVIFGTQDGLLTTLGLVSGVGGATTDRNTILLAAVAGSLAGMLAMGAGAYISSKSQLEVAEAEVERERRELDLEPERELEELVQLFEDEGLPEDDARVVAEKIAQRPHAMLNAMTQKELGLQLTTSQPRAEGVVMALAFLVGSLVPIVPWLVAPTTPFASAGHFDFSLALVWSVSATVLALFGMGAGKSLLARRSSVYGGFEMAAIGLLSATVGFVLGTFLPHLLGARIGGAV